MTNMFGRGFDSRQLHTFLIYIIDPGPCWPGFF